MDRYYGSLEVKKEVYVFAENKTEARKKIKAKLEKQSANKFVKIDYIE